MIKPSDFMVEFSIHFCTVIDYYSLTEGKPMLKMLMPAILLLAIPTASLAKQCSDNLNFEVRTLNDNKVVNLCEEYSGKVIMVVNTASKCGYTYQYEGLEALYAKHKDDGLVILGFPSNDFGGQEPGTEKQIQEFCVNTYAVKFPMFQKTRVKKQNADPLYKKLGDQAGYPGWNFHKYLIDRKGNLVESFRSSVKPESEKLVSRVESLLLND
jgi:glutathione peroxidase